MEQKNIIAQALLAVQEVVAGDEYATFSDLCVEVPLNDPKYPETLMVIWGEENDADDQFYNVSIYSTDGDFHKDQLVQVFSEDTTWGALMDAISQTLDSYEDISANRVKISRVLQEVEAFEEKHGLEINVDKANFIDDDHLDVVWYGGELLSFKYRDCAVSIVANGEVCIEGEYCGKDFYYRNKAGNGAFNMAASDTLRTTFHTDAEFRYALGRNLIQYEDNNWFEIFVEKDGKELFSWVDDSDSVLDAIDPGSLLEIMSEIDKELGLPGVVSLRIGQQEFTLEQVCRALGIPKSEESKSVAVCVTVDEGKLVSTALPSRQCPAIETTLEVPARKRTAPIQISRTEQAHEAFDEPKELRTYCYDRSADYFMYFDTDTRPDHVVDENYHGPSVVVGGNPGMPVKVYQENQYVNFTPHMPEEQKTGLDNLIAGAKATSTPQPPDVHPDKVKGTDSLSH